MSCENCSGYGLYARNCPTCNRGCDVGIEELEDRPDDNLIDICKPKDINKVLYTMRPLQFFCWAHDCSYMVEIDNCAEIALKDDRGKIEFLAWPQHKDFFHEMDRSEVAESARWM
jgi:hypothetical protein